ncbi:uncharacterized protein LOC100183518 [Ciona intestinalis]
MVSFSHSNPLLDRILNKTHFEEYGIHKLHNNTETRAKHDTFSLTSNLRPQLIKDLGNMRLQHEEKNILTKLENNHETKLQNENTRRKTKSRRRRTKSRRKSKSASTKHKHTPSLNDLEDSKSSKQSCFAVYSTKSTTSSQKTKIFLDTNNGDYLKPTKVSLVPKSIVKKPYALPLKVKEKSRLILPPTSNTLLQNPVLSLPDTYGQSDVTRIVNRNNDTDNEPWSLPGNRSPRPTSFPSAQLARRNETIVLPPPPFTTKPFQASSKINMAAQVYSPQKQAAHCTAGFAPRLTHSEMAKITKRESNLSDRLKLIHYYGNDYHVITQREEQLKRKANAIKQQECRRTMHEVNEKQKYEQRKKIYALNELMAALEQENFRKFCETLDSS